MKPKKPYKLTLTKLEYLSSVDAPAQGDGARALLLKRNGDAFEMRARVSKLDDSLGLVFGYAFSSSLDGGKTPHVDYQDDAIDPDFLKTVTEFIEAGGKTDVNHNFADDGKIVFAWPLTPEINEAMGIKSDVVGLAVAVKPSPETYKRFQSGELTGFSIAGFGIREPLEQAKRAAATETKVVKASLYTNEVDGHQHQVIVYDDGTFYVQHATSAGAEYSHSHGIVFEGGQLTILADSGHTHELAEGQPGIAVVPADAIVVVQARDPRKVADDTVITDEKRRAARAAASKSTRSTPRQESEPMKTIVLTEAQFAHYSKLSGEAAEAFLAKSFDERNADIQKALEADPVVFKGEKTGIEVRKSHGDVALKLAQRAEENERKLAEQAETLRKRDEEIEKAAVRKLASDVLGGMPGDDETHDYIIASLRKGGDPVKGEKALETLRGMKASSTIGRSAPGVGGAEPPANATDKQGAFEALEKGLLAFAKEQNITKNVWTDGLAQFAKTEKGAALKRAYDEALAG